MDQKYKICGFGSKSSCGFEFVCTAAAVPSINLRIGRNRFRKQRNATCEIDRVWLDARHTFR